MGSIFSISSFLFVLFASSSGCSQVAVLCAFWYHWVSGFLRIVYLYVRVIFRCGMLLIHGLS